MTTLNIFVETQSIGADPVPAAATAASKIVVALT
jgi:hypothetical protein